MHPPILLLMSAAELSSRPLLERALAKRQATILTASSSEEGFGLLEQRQDIACLLVDESGGKIPSGPVLSYVRRARPAMPVLVFGAENSAKAAVEALRQGATDYLANPFTASDIRSSLDRTGVFTAAMTSSTSTHHRAFDRIISVSPQMQLVKHLAAEVAATDATVLITGESGTGKELFARAIHEASARSNGPFVALNCAGIPESLLESELFGFHRGAFTDAKQSKPGRFQTAEGGTLFLDEIGEMSPAAQVKLLRVLEDRTISPLGGTSSMTVDIRILAATNEDLPAQIKTGKFRLDLYYRLNVYQLRVPPLRQRLEDIEPIAASFLEAARRDQRHPIQRLSPDALAILQRHDWAGNVRELHNVVEGLTITCKDTVILPDHLPPSVRDTGLSHPKVSENTSDESPLLAFGLSFQDMEKKLLVEALRQAGGNVSEASRLLKLTRNTLRYRMAKYNLC